MKMLGRIFGLLRPTHDFSGRNHEFFELLLGHAPNAWLYDNTSARKSLDRFFALFPTITLNRLATKTLYMVPCSGHMSATLSFESEASVILIFPDMYRSLVSADPSEAYAILAHEIGHILGEHTARGLSSLEAQIEADAFACSLGYRDTLRELLRRDGSEESRMRLGVINKEFTLSYEESA